MAREDGLCPQQRPAPNSRARDRVGDHHNDRPAVDDPLRSEWTASQPTSPHTPNTRTRIRGKSAPVRGRPANFGLEWFKTFEKARVHILDLAAYIVEEELRIAAA